MIPHPEEAQFFVIVSWATLADAETAAAVFYTNPFAMKRIGMSEVVLYNHFMKGLAQ
jgi:hypothetical protein